MLVIVLKDRDWSTVMPCVDSFVVNPIGQRNQDEEDDEPGQHPYSSHESAMAGAQRRA